MLKSVKGDILESEADAIIITCNCVPGVWGKGLALQAKTKLPAVYEYHKFQCELGNVKPGSILPYKCADGKTIICFQTKDHWKNPSNYAWIKSGLEELMSYLNEHKEIKSLATVLLGCGNGGLDPSYVKPLIEWASNCIEQSIFLYE